MSYSPNFEEDIATLFGSKQQAFPHLAMHLTRNHPHVDVSMEIPKQPGNAFDLNINLQGDELHMGTGGFWLEWFPCTKPNVVAEFQDAVQGLLSGTYRIVEHVLRGRVVKAQLQRRTDDGWRTVGTSGGLYLPIGRKTTRVLQNV